MIRLEIEGYCQNCLDFSPEVIKPTRIITSNGEYDDYTDTIIRCQYHKRCETIKKYLIRQGVCNE